MPLSKELVVSIKDFSFDYDVKYYNRKYDLRQFFIDAITSPIDTFFANNQKNYVLKNINLDIHEGDRVGILGINGCGKTTLCRQIAGMGKSNDFAKTEDVKAILNTDVAAFPELTGRENIEVLVSLFYTKLTSDKRAQIVEDAIEFSGINEFIDTPFKNYSKGMKARVFLSTISSEPSKLLILDEVFDGADTFFSEKISRRVKSMIARSGAVIFVSHDLSKIKEVCNRVVVIHEGKIIFDGNVHEGIKHYFINCGPGFLEAE
jgi:ABC-type polysaccharide/polyol phosphate transport system ATPase subunit